MNKNEKLTERVATAPRRVECDPNLDAALDLMHRYRNDGSCEAEILKALLDKDRLLIALWDAVDGLYNGFEPDNQSARYLRVKAAAIKAGGRQ